MQDEIASLKLVEQKNILDNFQFHRKINIQNKLLDMYAGEEMYLAGFNRVFSVFLHRGKKTGYKSYPISQKIYKPIKTTRVLKQIMTQLY